MLTEVSDEVSQLLGAEVEHGEILRSV
jgi:hypothetical protein